MIVAGCDIGSLTAKAVLLKDNEVVASAVMRAKPRPEDSARGVMGEVMAAADISSSDIAFITGTGYGRQHVPFVNSSESEIACHARGALYQCPGVRAVIDIGGQDAKAIKFDEKGNVLRYVYNDKCASGTGRFLEIIADALEIELGEMGEISSRWKKRLTLSNQCVVFAETEIISLVNEGEEIPDIINALHHSVANRAASLAKSIVVEGDVAMTGGVAKNRGMFAALQEALGIEMKHVSKPQINGALGAALFAAEHMAAGTVSAGRPN